jgi:hypothetical protein
LLSRLATREVDERGKSRMTHEEVAEGLLTPLWRGIPSEYKAKYARNIWEQFENNIRSSAYTARAPEFLSKMALRLGIVITVGLDSVAGIINSGNDRELLKMLREDTTLLVLLVRVANEERKEEWKKKKEAQWKP